MPLIWLDDLRLHAELSGPANGPALVLLNGLGTDLSLWDPLLPLLPPTLRLLRFDMRGHGRSDTPPAPYAMGALIRDAERLMDHHALKDAVVVGLSLGGLVAQGLAVKRLDLVRAMVLSNTAARIGAPSVWQDRIATVRAGGLEAIADATMARWFGRQWRALPDAAARRSAFVAANAEGWCGGAAAIAGADFYETTATLTLPTLAIAGDHDGSTPPDLVRETAELIRGSRFELIRGAGHIPLFEKPAAYAALVAEFLQDIGHV